MQIKRKLTIISVVFITIVVIPSQGLTFSKEMHETINGNIAQRTIDGFSLDDYLLNQLGFKDGVLEPLYGGGSEILRIGSALVSSGGIEGVY